jgi:hypothetical protein
MIFKQFKDGSCDIEFSWKERILLLKKGKLHFTDESFKNFTNMFVKMAMDWQLNFNDKLKNKITTENDTLEGK